MTAGGARRGARVARVARRSSSVAWRTAYRASRMELAQLRRMGATMRERALARRRAHRDGGRVLLAGFACMHADGRMHAMRSFARVRAIRASTSGFSKRTRSESCTGRRRCSARSARTCSTAGLRTTGG
ncbi:hypothetical protein [Burkholderia pseudomallei]|uniref:hypothetical protein n=1 Tax=Burkholderia pseudomallei TaxID=28450 RepID=UPI00287B6156|nr:hypothetical protein [Burkholderia pseudomallei]